MTTRKLDYDPLTGAVNWFVADGDTVSQVTVWDEEAGLRQAHESRKESRGTGNWQGDGYHKVGWIPPSVMERMMLDGTWGDENAVRKWINSAEAAPYRYRHGKV